MEILDVDLKKIDLPAVEFQMSTEDSREAGKDVAGVGILAEPGIIMLANPDVSI